MKKLILILLLAFSLSLVGCNAGNLIADTEAFGTPIPTVAVHQPVAAAGSSLVTRGRCQIAAVDLLAAWAEADYPESDAFDFEAVDGDACSGNFSQDVLPIFTQSNLWFAGNIACAACHGPDLEASYAQLDLSSYAGVMAGSRRLAEAKPIVGAAWEETKLYEVLVTTRFMPLARPANMPEKGPLVPAGTVK